MRHRISHCSPLVLAALIGLSGLNLSSAFANGRFPEAQRLLEHPGNPNRLYLTATYGLLVTEDRGQNWYTICEQAFAKEFLEGNPMLEVMPDGTLLGGLYNSLNRSTDCGCTWQPVLAAVENERVWDIAVDKSTGAVLALVEDSTTLPAKSSVHESTDGGKSWRKLSDLPTGLVSAFTLDVAPSDSSRVYVSGITANAGSVAGMLLVSSDHAGTWERRDFGTTSAPYPYIAAVHPTDPDRLFVRTDEWNDSGDYAADDALFYSADAGRSWMEIIRRPAKLFGFALSSDGATVLVGYGDPQQAGGRTTNSDEYGIYKADTVTFAFERTFFGAISCLRWTANGFYACIVENHPDVPTPGMSLGFAQNPAFTLATPTPLTSLLSVKNIRGPLGCTSSLCLENWKTGTDVVAPLCDVLLATCDVTPGSTGLSCAAGPGAGGSGGGGTTDGGRGGSGQSGTGVPSDGGGGNSGSAGSGGSSSGCGCFFSEPGDADGGAELIVFLAMIASRYAGFRSRRRARGTKVKKFAQGAP